MVAVNKIDSNATGLRFEEEESPGVLPGSPAWKPLEPNSYSDFGAQLTTQAREPINADRQRKKGVVTDLDASGGFAMDLTQDNFQQLAKGFFFKALDTKEELAITDTDTTGDDFQPASGGDGYAANDLLFAKDFDDAANNGLHLVTGAPGAATVPVTTNLVTASSQAGTISRVGFEFDAGDAEIDASGTLPRLTTAVKDLSDLGILNGEWVYLGGDLTAEMFDTAANNGFARVRSQGTNYLEFDKAEATMVTETDVGNALSIRLFIGRGLRNGSTDFTFQFERSLGAPDSALPAEVQSEYLVGAKANECEFQISTADKSTVDLSFIGQDFELRTGATGFKSGSRPTLTEGDAFNTSSDITRIKMALASNTDEAPTALFAYVTDLSIKISNNLDPNKAVGVLGSFDVTAGAFSVTASADAYFTTVTAVQTVRDNADVTIDAHMVRDNAGITLDLPLIALGEGRPNIEKDQPVKLPFTADAGTGAGVHANLDHTLLMMFWDYLPTAAG